jgi:hypothetical protein
LNIPAFVQLTQLEQLNIAFGALAVKPAYMVLSLILILWLRKTKERGLVFMRWGLTSFLFGESVCAANYLVQDGTNAAMEIMHGAGMLGASILVPWGLFRLFDEHVLRLTDPDAKCAVQRLCGQCWKRKNVACGFLRLSRFIAPALGFLAFLPFAAPLPVTDIVYPVLGSRAHFLYSAPVLMVEMRLYPLLAVGALLTALCLLPSTPGMMNKAQGVFFVGLGFLLYSLFRFVLQESFLGRPLWANFWEESTELLATLGLGFFLWTFRAQLRLSDGGRTPDPIDRSLDGGKNVIDNQRQH